MNNDIIFTEGPILPKLMKFSLPILAALFIQALYSAVDLWAVGRFATAADMSAVSTGCQAVYLFVGTLTGLCMGITVALAQKFGEKSYDQAADIAGTSFFILLFIGISASLLIGASAPQISDLVNAPPESFKETTDYIRICGAGSIFITAYNGFGGLFRGIGNSRAPLLFVAVSCVINIIGDIILIKFFGLGAAGAAVATVLAQGLSALFSVLYIKKEGLPFKVTKDNFRFDPAIARYILSLGLPIASTELANEISYTFIISLTNRLGVIVSAGVGTAERIIVFLLLIPMAFMSSISSFAAQNIGAGKKDRAEKCMYHGIAAAAVLASFMSYMMFFHGDLISMIFTDDPDVIHASAVFLKGTSLECFILSVSSCFTGYFNGRGKTRFVMLQGLFVVFAVKLPYAFLALKFASDKLFQISFSAAVSAFTSLTICITYFLINKHKEKKWLS